MTLRSALTCLVVASACIPVAVSAQDAAVGSTQAASAGQTEGSIDDAALRAMTTACLPAITGMIDTTDSSAAAETLSQAGYISVERPDPLLRMMAPKGSPALYFGQDTDKGRVSLALAQDRPFCTLALTGIDSSQSTAEAVAAHFASDGVPFEKSGDRKIANGQMTSADYDWRVDARRSIGARVMRPLVTLPKGKDFLLITMFVSNSDTTEN